MAVGAFAQTGPTQTSRVFTYDGSVATNGAVSLEFNGSPFFNNSFVSGTYNNSGLDNVDVNKTARFKAVTRARVNTYVYIGGTFSGEYTVDGFGSAATQASVNTNSITVYTNRSLSITPYNFTGLKDEAANNGIDYANVKYSLQFAKGDGNNGTYRFGPVVSGENIYFNGQSLILDLENTEAGHNGQFYLQFDRQITWLSERAQGNKTYSSTGYLTFTVLN